MMFMYNGYYLEVTPDKDVPTLLNGECSEAKFFYIGNSYDSTIKAFKTHIDSLKEEETEPCVILVQKILKNTPESKVELFQLLLDFKCKVEEGIGEKEYGNKEPETNIQEDRKWLEHYLSLGE